MRNELISNLVDYGMKFLGMLDSTADRVAEAGMKAGVATGTTTAAVAAANKVNLLSLDNVALYVGIVSTITLTVGSLWLKYWHLRRMQQLRLAEIKAGRDGRPWNESDDS